MKLPMAAWPRISSMERSHQEQKISMNVLMGSEHSIG